MRRHQEGFTFFEVALLLCVVGSLLAIFLPSFLRQLRLHKTKEASQELERLSERTQAYYREQHRGSEGRILRRCLPPPAGPSPELVSREPTPVDLRSPFVPGHTTWQALNYSPKNASRFRYSFFPSTFGCNLRGSASSPLKVVLRAEADLDGDGNFSRYERHLEDRGKGELQATGVLYVRDRTE